jgi:hypothetical protein
MSEDFRWWCGFDWASQKHHVYLSDATGRRLGEREVEHGGAGLGELCDWLIETTGGAPGEIAIAIETSSGPVVETFLARGFAVFSLNPKQLDQQGGEGMLAPTPIIPPLTLPQGRGEALVAAGAAVLAGKGEGRFRVHRSPLGVARGLLAGVGRRRVAAADEQRDGANCRAATIKRLISIAPPTGTIVSWISSLCLVVSIVNPLADNLSVIGGSFRRHSHFGRPSIWSAPVALLRPYYSGAASTRPFFSRQVSSAKCPLTLRCCRRRDRGEGSFGRGSSPRASAPASGRGAGTRAACASGDRSPPNRGIRSASCRSPGCASA